MSLQAIMSDFPIAMAWCSLPDTVITTDGRVEIVQTFFEGEDGIQTTV